MELGTWGIRAAEPGEERAGAGRLAGGERGGADSHCSSLDLWFVIRCTKPLPHSLYSVIMLPSNVVPCNTILYKHLVGCVSHAPPRRCATTVLAPSGPPAPLLTHLWSVLSLPSLQPSTDAGWCVSVDTVNGRFYIFLFFVLCPSHD